MDISLHFRITIWDILRPFWDQGMTDLSSEKGKQLAKEAMAKSPHITKNQIKVNLRCGLILMHLSITHFT